MDLRDLRYFETIAELEHVGRAAARLHRSPPALTKCIRRLEDSLGTALFEPHGRGIRLTAAGRTLHRRAKLLDVAVEDTLREIGAVTRGASGHVRIGVAPTIAQYLLPGACRSLLADGSDVTIETLIGMSNLLRNALRDGTIDMAISVANPADDFVAHPIVDDDVVVVAGSDHEIFRRRASMADLARYRWVLPVASYDTEIRRFVDAAFQRHRLRAPQVQIETNSVTFLPNLIAATGLLSFISRRNLGRGHVAAPLREVKISEMVMRRQFALLYRRDSYLSPAAVKFMDLLRTRGQSLFAKATPPRQQ
jgi:DNA-binding transcriptional LysR family regulator